jgi:hypothetical protein
MYYYSNKHLQEKPRTTITKESNAKIEQQELLEKEFIEMSGNEDKRHQLRQKDHFY